MAIIGIDLGTTNSLACIYRDGRAELIPNELGEYKTSSAVSVLQDGTVLVGAAAKERLVSHPEATAASFKIWMGMERLPDPGWAEVQAGGALRPGTPPAAGRREALSRRAGGGGRHQCPGLL